MSYTMNLMKLFLLMLFPITQAMSSFKKISIGAGSVLPVTTLGAYYYLKNKNNEVDDKNVFKHYVAGVGMGVIGVPWILPVGIVLSPLLWLCLSDWARKDNKVQKAWTQQEKAEAVGAVCGAAMYAPLAIYLLKKFRK